VQLMRKVGDTILATPHQEQSKQEMIIWEKPARGRYKCNIDASFSSSLNRVGIGICIRDNAGDFVLMRTDWFSPLCDVTIG
jgi:hypothetical protein